MPNKTIYVSDENLPLFESVSNDGDKSISYLFSKFLKEMTGEIEAKKTLRDEFAMAALQALGSQVHVLHANDAADYAYRWADAMLKARKL